MRWALLTFLAFVPILASVLAFPTFTLRSTLGSVSLGDLPRNQLGDSSLGRGLGRRGYRGLGSGSGLGSLEEEAGAAEELLAAEVLVIQGGSL